MTNIGTQLGNTVLADKMYNELSDMEKIFYVDQINGDDSNDGSNVSPFKTLQKAIDDIPTGGLADIHIVGDYVLTSNISIDRKTRVSLILYGTLTTTEYSPRTNYTGIYSINVIDSKVCVDINSYNNAKIVVPAKTSTNDVDPGHYGIFNVTCDSNFANIKLFLVTAEDDYNPIIVNSGFGLVSVDECKSNEPKLNVKIVGYYSGTNRNIIVNSNSTLVSFKNGTGTFHYKYSGGLTNETNDPIPVSNCVDGIVKSSTKEFCVKI